MSPRPQAPGGHGQGAALGSSVDGPFVVAIIELSVPLNIPVTADKWAKQEAVGEMLMHVLDLLPDELGECAAGHWEDLPGLEPKPAGTGGEAPPKQDLSGGRGTDG